MRRLALCALAVALLGPDPAQAEELRSPFSQVGIDQRLDARAPLDLSFRDEKGGSVRLGDYFGGRPVILTLAYYRCPMLCTLVLGGLARSSGALNLSMGRDFTMVTVSIDPRETPDLAAASKRSLLEEHRRLGGGEAWHFLTGEQGSIERLAEAVGFRYARDPATGQFAHGSGIVVLTPDGRVSRYFLGIDFAPRDLRLALVEASAGRIGSLADKLLLLCYQYDPASGRYGAVAFKLVRAAGLLTVLGVACFVTVMLRRERAARVG